MRGWLVLLLVASTAAAQSDLDETFRKDQLILVASENQCYRFDIYVAETDAQRAQGLMFVRDLPDTTGMWFIYEQERRVSIWMKNTYIPLDILYLRGNGQVSSIFHDAEPLSLRSMPSIEPVQFVLELNGGLAKSLGIDSDSYVIMTPALSPQDGA